MDSNYQVLTEDQKMKAIILTDTKKICEEVGKQMDAKFDSNSTELIAEVVWKKLQLISTDLEAFATHGKRATVNCDDIKLLVRRNPDLKNHITKKVEELTGTASTSKEVKAPAKRKKKT